MSHVDESRPQRYFNLLLGASLWSGLTRNLLEDLRQASEKAGQGRLYRDVVAMQLMIQEDDSK